MKKREKGITLVALVITIILLLILAGISIQAITNQGIFEQAHNARKESQRAQVTEWLNLKLMEQRMYKTTGTSEQIIEATRVDSKGNTELAKMGKKVVVDESTSTLEDGEQVPVYFYVQVDEDVYKVEMTGAKFIGEQGKFPPVITLENVTKTTNSITLKIKTSRNEEGELKIYIKSEEDADYTIKKTATGNEATGLEYTISGLVQNKNYSIKIVATAKNGQIKEYVKDVPLGSVPTGVGTITFTPATWSNGKASTTISSTETGYIIQYQINSISESGWTTGTNVTGLKHGDKLYARFWDGKNGGTAAINNILDGTDPSASIELSSQNVYTTGSITAKVTHTDNESGVKIANCKWIYNTTSTPIGTDANYTGGTFSSNPQTITLSSSTVGTYYLHVLTTDVAGRTKETISNAVTVKADPSLPTNPATTIAEAQSQYMLTKTVNSPIVDAYGNKITVPAGFRIKVDSTTNNATTVDKGIVIIDSNENEFVWIPVGTIYTNTQKTASETIELGRYSFASDGTPSACSDPFVEEDSTDTANLKNYGNTIAKDINTFKTKASATQSGGFYIGRYEARTATARSAETDALTTLTTKSSDYIYNYVTQLQAAERCQTMYGSDKPFTSDLINSYAWDTATLFLQTCGDNTTYSRKTSVNDSLATTGTNKQDTKDVQCNVYDMASNVREWTTETYSYSIYPCVSRGGLYSYSDYYTSYRIGSITSYSSDLDGFRPLLYL